MQQYDAVFVCGISELWQLFFRMDACRRVRVRVFASFYLMRGKTSLLVLFFIVCDKNLFQRVKKKLPIIAFHAKTTPNHFLTLSAPPFHFVRKLLLPSALRLRRGALLSPSLYRTFLNIYSISVVFAGVRVFSMCFWLSGRLKSNTTNFVINNIHLGFNNV